MSLFSKNLRFLRKKGQFKQEDISVLFSKQANTIGNWENDKSEPNLAELVRLGEFFKTSVEELLNSDLESQSTEQNMEPGSIGFQSDSNQTKETLDLPSNNGSQEAFWLLLRELRSLHEKVDLLALRAGSASFQKTSDKSSH